MMLLADDIVIMNDSTHTVRGRERERERAVEREGERVRVRGRESERERVIRDRIAEMELLAGKKMTKGKPKKGRIRVRKIVLIKRREYHN